MAERAGQKGRVPMSYIEIIRIWILVPFTRDVQYLSILSSLFSSLLSTNAQLVFCIIYTTPHKSPIIYTTPHKSPRIYTTPHKSPIIYTTPHKSPSSNYCLFSVSVLQMFFVYFWFVMCNSLFLYSYYYLYTIKVFSSLLAIPITLLWYFLIGNVSVLCASKTTLWLLYSMDIISYFWSKIKFVHLISFGLVHGCDVCSLLLFCYKDNSQIFDYVNIVCINSWIFRKKIKTIRNL